MLGTLNQEEIKAVLEQQMLGRIACRDGNELYIVPVNYVFVKDAVICHSFEGKKLEFMRRNPEVCFEVEDMTDHRNWSCVVAQGFFEELTDHKLIESVRPRLQELSLKRKASLTAAPPAEQPSLDYKPHGTSVYYRIRFTRLSGRFERVL